ncbi:calcium-transporting ATPase 4, endoplasmic reticulum-type-like [Silene latifolia]|uniref:calcium-transporting ATPase 4, endoplasmic reticulum-type-like n=1 Tax=Silene latifolia TaxID=37657 RepID=UPI003D77F3FB
MKEIDEDKQENNRGKNIKEVICDNSYEHAAKIDSQAGKCARMMVFVGAPVLTLIGVRKRKCGDSFSPWTKDVKECEEKYGVSRDVSLSSEDVEKRQRVYGLNELDKHKGGLVWRLILDQFNDTLVRILLCSAVVSFVLQWYDGDEGDYAESNAEKALEALKEIQSEHATVIRDGKKDTSLPVKEFIPGDIVELRVADKVPADMWVLTLNTSTLRVKQGSLTGESGAVSKTLKPVSEDTDSQGKKCMVFVGTTVVNGNFIFLVTYIGMRT